MVMIYDGKAILIDDQNSDSFIKSLEQEGLSENDAKKIFDFFKRAKNRDGE